MMKKIMDTVKEVHSPAIKGWKAKGRKVVGNLCTFVPVEVFYAAGILPVRFRGIEAKSMDIGDAYYGPFICSCPKSILQMICEGKYAFLDGAVITPGCDSMRRLDDCWQKAAGDYAGIVPPFFTYFGVPHKVVPYSVEWFVTETRRLIADVEKHFQVTITDDKLREAIRVYNRGRELLHRLQDFRTGERVAISGADAFAVAIAGTAMPRDEYNATLEKIIDDLKKQTDSLSQGKKRLMVIGSVCDDTSLVKLIEDEGGIVVSDNLCFGVRHTREPVSEEGDPVMSLAEWYLSRSICPRMFGNYQERLAILKEKIDRAKVEGVIMQNIRFCDLHGSENGLFQRALEASGTPCLQLELEYGPLVEVGRIRMRIDAFLERIS